MNEKQERLIEEAEAKLLDLETAKGLTLVSTNWGWSCGVLFLFGLEADAPPDKCKCLVLAAVEGYDTPTLNVETDFTSEVVYAMYVADVISEEQYEAVKAFQSQKFQEDFRQRELAQLRRLKWKYETEDA